MYCAWRIFSSSANTCLQILHNWTWPDTPFQFPCEKWEKRRFWGSFPKWPQRLGSQGWLMPTLLASTGRAWAHLPLSVEKNEFILLQGNVYSKAAIASHGSQTTKLIVATLNRKVSRSLIWKFTFIHVKVFCLELSMSHCARPCGCVVVPQCQVSPARWKSPLPSLLTAPRLLGAAVYLHSQWGRDHLHRCLQPVHSWQWLCHWGEFMRSTKGKFSPFPKRYFLAKVFGGWIGTLGNSCSWCDYNSTKWRNSRLMRYVYM